MKIGEFVREHISEIFAYCEEHPHELSNLMDAKFSKKIFNIAFPFCKEFDTISPTQKRRYWQRKYTVLSKEVCVTNHWYAYQHSQFKQYLADKEIASDVQFNEAPSIVSLPSRVNLPPNKSRLFKLENKVANFEEEICIILAQLAYHIAPEIIAYIQNRNTEEYNYFADLFANKIELSNYLFAGSACVFPGVRRYVSGKGMKKKYNPKYKAIIDDNIFPRYLWCHLANGTGYSGPTWKNTNLNQFELAHVFTHKETEITHEKKFFNRIDENLAPCGEFTCAANVVLLPKGTVRPTDNSPTIKSVFYKRYIDLYGESPLNGRSGLKSEIVPAWADNLPWNEPFKPDDWQDRIDKLLKYRTKRISQILN